MNQELLSAGLRSCCGSVIDSARHFSSRKVKGRKRPDLMKELVDA